MSNRKAMKVKKKSHLTGVVFWTSLILILTPCLVLGWILLSSSMDTGAPVLGNRYDGDLDPSITRTQIDTIVDQVKGIANVESSFAEMPTATLRVYADVNDFVDLPTMQSVSDQIYDTVASVLDPEIYFRQYDGKKMYDLEIHVYNLKENRDSEDFKYIITTKTSAMTNKMSLVVSDPLDGELAESLRQAAYARQHPEESTNPDGGEIVVNDENDLQTEGNPEESGEEQGGE